MLGNAIESVDQASKKTTNLPTPEEQSCTHNYTFLCPQGWNDVGDAATCEAPPSYTGPCSTLGMFDREIEEKKLLEKKCLVHWPCLEECVRDYKALCPEGWTEIGEGKCSASSSYTGLKPKYELCLIILKSYLINCIDYFRPLRNNIQFRSIII